MVEIADIQRAVAGFFAVSMADLTGLHRTVPLAQYRQIAYWLCRQHTVASYPAIARKFGSRAHATILHGVRAVDKRLAQSSELRATVEKIEVLANLDCKLRRTVLVEERLREVEEAQARIDARHGECAGLAAVWS